MTLKQAHWPGKIVFEIKGDYLFIKSSRWGNYNENKVLLDNISGERLEMRTAKSAFLIASLVFAAIAAVVFVSRLLSVEVEPCAESVWVVLSVICLLLFYRSIRHYAKITLRTGGFLFIETNKPSKELAAKFIDELLKRRFYERATLDQNARLN